MENRLPAVVAVVVTSGAAPGLEATLASLTTQDYPELSVLVVANGDTDDVATRVAAVAPLAFVRQLETNRGYAAACNEGAVHVEGAVFWLFCHDDVQLDDTCVSRMLEAAVRTNAGVVTPKMVDYVDPMVLRHVGLTADRFGAVRDRIEEGEIDHGQQDLERDVFVAPGGVTLVRADLFATLRGYDPVIAILGEDLDLCWRAQVAGARIVVAPLARVRHRESIARGERLVTGLATKGKSRQDLQRRHQLLTVLSGWGRRYLAVTVAMLLILDVVEVGVALVGRDTDRVGAIIGSWRWCWNNRSRIVERRRELQRIRVLSDVQLHRLMVPGASRLRHFTGTLLREGYDKARGVFPEELLAVELDDEDRTGVGFGATFSDTEEFDEIPTSEALDARRSPATWLTSFRAQAALIVLVAIGWLIGSRNLVAMHLPLIGRLAPLDSWWSTWRHYFASWSPNGVGTGTPAMPGYGVLGFAGTFVLGRMGILPRLVLIASVPMAAVGTSRLVRGRVSNRARVAAVVVSVGMPIGLNAISQGRTDVLILVAAAPFIVRRLFEVFGVAGFRNVAFGETVPFGHRGWRASERGQRTVLVMAIAFVGAFVPAIAIDVVVVAVSVVFVRWIDRVAEDQGGAVWRPLGSILGNVAIFLLPLSVDVVLAGRRALSVFGLARAPWQAPGISQVLKGVDGLYGAGWTGWLVLVVAATGVALARGPRRALARYATVIYVVSVTLSEASLRHWMGSFTPEPDALLALAGVMVVVLVALAVSAIENDLAEFSFGWRQLLAAVSIVALVVSSVPEAAAFASGRFDLPTTSVAESLSQLAPSVSGYRVLWLGDPSVLPASGWSVAPGIEATTSTNGLPGGDTLFTPPDSGTSDVILRAVSTALSGRTVNLGALLAPAGISAIVVVNSAAPTLAGVTTSIMHPASPQLLNALSNQSDLSLELATPDASIYSNAAFVGLVRAVNTTTGAASPTFTTQGFSGLVTPGARYVAGLAPAGAWALDVHGRGAARSTQHTWYPHYAPRVTRTTSATLTLRQFPLNGILALFTLGLWLVVWLGFGTLETLEQLLAPRRGRRRKR